MHSDLTPYMCSDFGPEADRLIAICLNPHGKPPHYKTHVEIALSVTGLHLTEHQKNQSICAYAYLNILYYMIDAINDGHPLRIGEEGVPTNACDPAILLTAAISRICKVTDNFDGSLREKAIDLIKAALAENSRALSQEKFYNDSPFNIVNLDDEYFHLWARSNIFLFLFEFFALISGRPLSASIRIQIQRLLFLSQLADDLSDWRVDFEEKNWTPFLRKCVIADNRLLTFEDVEEYIYLSGFFENEVIFLYKSFSDLFDALPDSDAISPLKSSVGQEIKKAKETLLQFVNTKLLADAKYETAS